MHNPEELPKKSEAILRISESVFLHAVSLGSTITVVALSGSV